MLFLKNWWQFLWFYLCGALWTLKVSTFLLRV